MKLKIALCVAILALIGILLLNVPLSSEQTETVKVNGLRLMDGGTIVANLVGDNGRSGYIELPGTYLSRLALGQYVKVRCPYVLGARLTFLCVLDE